MSTITWLHLSDLHFRAGELHKWDQDIVLRALMNDVRERIVKILIIEWKIISTCLSCPKFSIGHPVLVFKPSGFPLNTLRE
jgi:hypothetical protein